MRHQAWRTLCLPGAATLAASSLSGRILNLLFPCGPRTRAKGCRGCASRVCACAFSISARGYRACCLESWRLLPWPEEVEEDPSKTVYLRFENKTDAVVAVYWFSHTGEQQFFYTLNPGCSTTQETFAGNVWMVKEEEPPKRLLKRVKVLYDTVQRQLCYIRPVPETTIVDPGADEHAVPDVRIPSCYTHVVETDLGIPIVADSDVCMAALHAGADIIKHMLEGCPEFVLKGLRHHWCKVAVIARHKVTTDILEHSHLRGTPVPDGRDWDVGVRGLGGTLVIPTCSVGEENLLRCPDDKFGQESILIHEFAHTVMEVGLDQWWYQRIKDCYLRSKCRYKAGIYMVADEKEYWAEGTQSWFNSSLRSDVNDGINTREKVREHDPELATLLEEVYGDGQWRYNFSPIPAD